MNSVLERLALKNTPFMHGGGRRATLSLMECLEMKGNEKVLECGFGTWASLVTLNAAYPELDLHEIEVSPLMMSISGKRVSWAGLGDIKLHSYAENLSFPFPSGIYDRVLSGGYLNSGPCCSAWQASGLQNGTPRRV